MNGIGVHRIADAVTIPVDGKIVACAPRQNMHMNMWHRLPGDFTVRLHQAQSARPQRLVHRASQLSHGCAHGSKTLRRHLEHGCKMGARDHQAMPFIGRMDIHEGQSRLIPIELMTLLASGNDLAENALRSGHGVLPAKVIDRRSVCCTLGLPSGRGEVLGADLNYSGSPWDDTRSTLLLICL